MRIERQADSECSGEALPAPYRTYPFFRVPDYDFLIWQFPKIRGTLFWGPYNKDPTI